jgi:hypothetical protein
MYLEVPATPDVLCSVHSKITWILLPSLPSCYFFFFGWDYLTLALVLFKTAAIPFFINCFTVDAATLRVIHLSSSGR